MNVHRGVLNLGWMRGDRLPIVTLEVFTEPVDWDGQEETLSPYDLTGKTLALYVKRQEIDEDTAAIAALDTANGGLVWLPEQTNEVQIHPTVASTATAGQFSWRLVVTENGKPLTPLHGRWDVTPA